MTYYLDYAGLVQKKMNHAKPASTEQVQGVTSLKNILTMKIGVQHINKRRRQNETFTKAIGNQEIS